MSQMRSCIANVGKSSVLLFTHTSSMYSIKFTLPKEEGRRFGKLFEFRVVVTSEHSGMDSYREALTRGMLAISDQFRLSLSLDCIRFVRTCNKDELPQKDLLEMNRQVDRGSSCVFSDINDRLCETALDLVDAMMPPAKASKASPTETFSVMLDWLADNWHWAYLGTSECLSRNKHCPTYPFDTGVHAACSRPLVINTSGMTCTGWSAVSSRQSCQSERGKNMLSLRLPFFLKTCCIDARR